MKQIKFLLIALFALSLVPLANAQGFAPEFSISKKLRKATEPLGATDYEQIESAGQKKYTTMNAIKKGIPFAVTVPNVNLQTVAVTPLVTVPAGVRFVAIVAKIETTTGTAITTPATISIGSSGTTATSLVASGALAASPAAGQVQTLTTQAVSNAYIAADVIQLNVTAGAVGTAQVATIHLVGYYL